MCKLPLVLLPADAKDTHWVAEAAKRDTRFRVDDAAAWRTKDADARWGVNLSDKPGGTTRFTFATGGLRVDGWTASGKVSEALGAARKQLVAQLDGTAPSEGKGKRETARPAGWGGSSRPPTAMGTVPSTERNSTRGSTFRLRSPAVRCW